MISFKHLHFLFLFCVMAGAGASAGAGTVLDDWNDAWTTGRTTHVLDIDNDSLKLNRDDGFYTSGLRYTQRRAVHSSRGLTVSGWRLGQELYTASDINLPPERIGPPDHPYAAWLYGGFFEERHEESGRQYRVGIDFGCIGPCAGGKATQDFLHGILDQPKPKGWGKQVRNEAGIVLYGDLTPVRWSMGRYLDIAPSLHGRFGNIFTDAGAGITARFGKLNVLPGQATLHGFVRLDGRAVAHNATLEGGYFSDDNSHTVKPRRFVREAEAGVVWHEESLGLVLSIVHRDNEIKGLPDSIGEQDFVRLGISYTP